jgi:hypothetical protein
MAMEKNTNMGKAWYRNTMGEAKMLKPEFSTQSKAIKPRSWGRP